MSWTWPVSDDEAARRAAGRRHYNSIRRLHAELRRVKVAELLRGRFLDWGVQAEIARELGVSRSTVCRDVRWLMRRQ